MFSHCIRSIGQVLVICFVAELLRFHQIAPPPHASKPVGASGFTHALSAFSPIARTQARDDDSCLVFLGFMAQPIAARNWCSTVPTAESRVSQICSSPSDAFGRRARLAKDHLLCAAFLFVLQIDTRTTPAVAVTFLSQLLARDMAPSGTRKATSTLSKSTALSTSSPLALNRHCRCCCGSENHPANSHWTLVMLISRRRLTSELHTECSDSRTVPSPFSHAYPLSMG
jgi:hypothetical protein